MGRSSRIQLISKQIMGFAMPVTEGTLEEYMAKIPDELIMEPNMPVGVAIQEARNISNFAREDKTALTTLGGLNWGTVEETPKRCNLLRDKEINLWSIRFSTGPAAKRLEQCKKTAEAAIDEIGRVLKHSYDNDPKIIELLEKISEAETPADYNTKLGSFLALAERENERLRALNMDQTHIDNLAQCVKDFGHLHYYYMDELSENRQAMKNRNRACLFLQVAVERIRRCAEHALFDNPERLRGYRSEYFRKSRRRKPKKD